MPLLSILGLGSALPDRVVSNDEFEAISGFPAARVRELFEIEQRRWARGAEAPDPPTGQRCSDLAVLAGSRALEAAGVKPRELGGLLVVTATPDSLNPPVDAIVARGLGALGIPAWTLLAPCTGLFRALKLASRMVGAEGAGPLLLITAETPSPFFRFGPDVPTEQLLNAALYADGAAAVVVAEPTLGGGGPVVSLVDLALHEDQSEPGITFPGMLSAMPPAAGRYESMDYLGHHDFTRVLRRGGKLAALAANRAMERFGIGAKDVRFFLTHQATGNLRRIAASHGLPPEKVAVNIDRVGNTISASILLLLDEVSREEQLESGDLLVLHTAESSTWSSAGAVVRW